MVEEENKEEEKKPTHQVPVNRNVWAKLLSLKRQMGKGTMEEVLDELIEDRKSRRDDFRDQDPIDRAKKADKLLTGAGDDVKNVLQDVDTTTSTIEKILQKFKVSKELEKSLKEGGFLFGSEGKEKSSNKFAEASTEEKVLLYSLLSKIYGDYRATDIMKKLESGFDDDGKDKKSYDERMERLERILDRANEWKLVKTLMKDDDTEEIAKVLKWQTLLNPQKQDPNQTALIEKALKKDDDMKLIKEVYDNMYKLHKEQTDLIRQNEKQMYDIALKNEKEKLEDVKKRYERDEMRLREEISSLKRSIDDLENMIRSKDKKEEDVGEMMGRIAENFKSIMEGAQKLQSVVHRPLSSPGGKLGATDVIMQLADRFFSVVSEHYGVEKAKILRQVAEMQQPQEIIPPSRRRREQEQTTAQTAEKPVETPPQVETRAQAQAEPEAQTEAEAQTQTEAETEQNIF